MAAPTIKVEVAFNSQPFSDAPVWTDITSSVRRFTTLRGRSYELDRMEAGTCSLVLDNSDGAFTPGRTSSPYYPNVKPRRRVRITATHGGTTYPVAAGYVERWEVEFNGASLAEVHLEAVDGFATLSGVLLNTPLRETILDHGPVYYWPLTDDAGSERAGNLVDAGAWAERVYSGVGLVGTAEFGGMAVVIDPGVDDDGTCWQVSGADDDGMAVLRFLNGGSPPWPFATNDEFTFACLWKGTALPPAGKSYTLFHLAGSDGSALVTFKINADASVSLVVAGTGGTNTFATPTNIGANEMAHLSFRLSPSAASIWIGTASDAVVNVPFTPTYAALKGVPAFGMLGGELTPTRRASGMNGSLSHAVVYGALGAVDPRATVEALVQANSEGAGETDRLHRVLSLSKWPAALMSFDTSLTAVSGLRWPGGSSALGLLHEYAEDAGGYVFVDKQGRLAYHNRHRRIGAPVVATLKHSDGTGYEPDVRLVEDDGRIVNDVTVDRPGGITARSADAASIAEHGRKALHMTKRILSDAEVEDAAAWAVGRGKDAKLRLDSISLNVAASEALWPIALALEIGDRIKLDELPEYAPFASGTFFIEGIEHVVSQVGAGLSWITNLQLSPAEDSDGWVLEDDTYGILESDECRLVY